MIIRPVDLVNTDIWPSLADNPKIRTTFHQLVVHVLAARPLPTIVPVPCYFRMSRHTLCGGRSSSPRVSGSWRFVLQTATPRKLAPEPRDSSCMRL